MKCSSDLTSLPIVISRVFVLLSIKRNEFAGLDWLLRHEETFLPFFSSSLQHSWWNLTFFLCSLNLKPVLGWSVDSYHVFQAGFKHIFNVLFLFFVLFLWGGVSYVVFGCSLRGTTVWLTAGICIFEMWRAMVRITVWGLFSFCFKLNESNVFAIKPTSDHLLRLLLSRVLISQVSFSYYPKYINLCTVTALLILLTFFVFYHAYAAQSENMKCFLKQLQDHSFLGVGKERLLHPVQHVYLPRYWYLMFFLFFFVF